MTIARARNGRLLAAITAAIVAMPSAAGAQHVVAEEIPAPVAEVFYGALAAIGDDPTTSGSGFLVSDAGHVLTAWSVLETIRSRDPGAQGRTYLQRRYPVHFNSKDRGIPCRATAVLVEGSEFRGIAVLQVNPPEWATRHTRGRCLGELTPVRLDLASWYDASRPTAYFNYLPAIWPLGRPENCRNPGALDCAAKAFDAWRTTIARYQNEFDLIELEHQVPAGFVGGPVVLEDGRVIGMMVTSGSHGSGGNIDGNGDDIPRIGVMWGQALERPLWTFGISIGDGAVRDYVEDMHDFLGQKPEIEEALEMLRDIVGTYASPRVVSHVINRDNMFRTPVIGVTFRKQLARIETPESFTYEVECMPHNKVEGLASFVAEQWRTEEVKGVPIEGPDLPQDAVAADGMTFDTFITRPVSELLSNCVSLLNPLLVEDAFTKLTPEDIEYLVVTATAQFDDAEIGTRALDPFRVDLPADFWQQ